MTFNYTEKEINKVRFTKMVKKFHIIDCYQNIICFAFSRKLYIVFLQKIYFLKIIKIWISKNYQKNF